MFEHFSSMLSVIFPVSGVEANVLIPPLVAFFISFFTSMGGVSGAFLLLPFQMSVLHYTAPSVSGTNLVYNIVAIPSGVFRYVKEGRMVWPLTLIIIAGTLPGIVIGYFMRIHWLADPALFKLFAGVVLLYLGLRIAYDLLITRKRRVPSTPSSALDRSAGGGFSVKVLSFTRKRVAYGFSDMQFSFSTPGMLFLSFVVGIVGGVYGVGGGAIIAPFCVTIFRLPVYTVAGPALMGTFITSVAGAMIYSFMPSTAGVSSSPDWALGALFGIGGFFGVYLGARFQRFVPEMAIKIVLGAVIIFAGIRYLVASL